MTDDLRKITGELIVLNLWNQCMLIKDNLRISSVADKGGTGRSINKVKKK
jgi:hypothetical protein